MTEGRVLDTTAHEPSRPGEFEMLLFALDRSRAQFAWKCGGLDEAVDGLVGEVPSQPG